MKNRAQATLEFTFAIVAILFLIYGTLRVFRWVGRDLAERRWEQDNSLLSSPLPKKQLRSDFYNPKSMDASYKGGVSKELWTPAN